MSRGRHQRARRTARPAIDPARLRRLARVGALVVAAVGAVVVGMPVARRVALTHPYFAVQEVAVRHHGQLTADEIRTLAGLAPGMNVWSIDEEAAAARLRAHGWVRTALVRRDPPSRVVVEVREYQPTAILAVEDESPGLYYLAANGRIFAPVGTDDARDLPFVTGLKRADLGGDDAFGPRAVHRALALLRHADRYARAVGTVSEVHVDRVAGLTVMPVQAPLPIEIGWGEYDAKLARVAEVLPWWSGREGEIRSVSCVYDDEVIVRTRPARPPGKGTRNRKATGRAAGLGRSLGAS